MKNRIMYQVICRVSLSMLFGLALLPLAPRTQAQKPADATWSAYGHDAGGIRYSSAMQITKSNVAQLKVAWTYRTGALDVKTDLIHKAAFETTPILVDQKLFLTTQYD